MKVIKSGKKLTEITCPTCEAVLLYESSDIKEETHRTIDCSLPNGLQPPAKIRRYIICPECNKPIYLDPVAR